jgi:DNA adenine methylase
MQPFITTQSGSSTTQLFSATLQMMNTYTGGKNGSGVYQQIISMMPPHRTYIELFLGSGAILKRKKKAAMSYGVDLDRNVLDAQSFENFDGAELSLHAENAVDFIDSRRHLFTKDALVYADPPYLESVRRTARRYYAFEMMTDSEHTELLRALKSLESMVMISGYDSELYDRILTDWRKEQFQTTNRAGDKVTETVWLNFPEPAELHDYRFLGRDRTHRQQIKRKKERWRERLAKMDSQERYALLSELEIFNSSRSWK